MRAMTNLLVGFAIASSWATARAEDPAASTDAITQAIRQAIPLLEKGSAGAADQRQCFTCHNLAVPVFALVEARHRGFTVNEENLNRQLKHTADHLARGLEDYRAGRGQGGQVLTAGYALWTLDVATWKQDETTEAVASYLAGYQKDQAYWRHRGQRPPSSGSDFTATYVALRGLNHFGTEAIQSQIAERREAVKGWLLQEQPAETEDAVFRLLSLPLVDAESAEIARAQEALVAQQRDDGGWAQKSDMESDVYATATALVALLETGVSRESTAVQRGLQYLLDLQLEDGSWHVVTRAQPFQTYFESGFPHGKDQFISMAASGWATLALLWALPAA